MAQEVALRDGGHAPTIITEGTAVAMAGQFLDLPETHKEKVAQMLISGYIPLLTRPLEAVLETSGLSANPESAIQIAPCS